MIQFVKTFRIRGGVHPDDRKELSAPCPIEPVPLPAQLLIPIQQHIGAPAEPAVAVGQRVLKGQLLARAQSDFSAPVHASTSGLVAAIAQKPAPHPSGLPVRTIIIEPDGLDEALPIEDETDPFTLQPTEISRRVAAAGIVGMGGATFPSAVKLNLGSRYKLHTLVINGAECEPYLTCDDRLMREQASLVLDGVAIMARALGVGQALVVIEDNKPEALAAMREASQRFDGIRVRSVGTRYPMGSERHLVQALTGRETPAGKLTADIGVVVHNPATARAVRDAVRFGIPLVERVVTISGGAIARPANLRVAIGTPVQHLLDHCGGFAEAPARLLAGGPMMGQVLPNRQVPIVKGTNGILALTADEARPEQAMPCIRCGRCVDACPCGLLPMQIWPRVRAGDFDGARDFGVADCITCGSCAYACPSHIPLVQYFSHAKGELRNRSKESSRQERMKLLTEARKARQAKQKAEKMAAMAKRKAEMAARKAAEEKAAQEESA